MCRLWWWLTLLQTLLIATQDQGVIIKNIKYIYSFYINTKLKIFCENICSHMTMYIKIINVYYTYTIMYINMNSALIYFCTTFTPESLDSCKIYPSCMCLPVHIFKTIYWGNFNIILLLNIDLSFPSVALSEFSFSFISLMFFV